MLALGGGMISAACSTEKVREQLEPAAQAVQPTVSAVECGGGVRTRTIARGLKRIAGRREASLRSRLKSELHLLAGPSWGCSYSLFLLRSHIATTNKEEQSSRRLPPGQKPEYYELSIRWRS